MRNSTASKIIAVGLAASGGYALSQTLEQLHNTQTRMVHAYNSMGEWTMPPIDVPIILKTPGGDIPLYVLPRDEIARLFPEACGFVQFDGATPTGIFVSPLNTFDDMACWRHELRHAIEGKWHP